MRQLLLCVAGIVRIAAAATIFGVGFLLPHGEVIGLFFILPAIVALLLLDPAVSVPLLFSCDLRRLGRLRSGKGARPGRVRDGETVKLVGRVKTIAAPLSAPLDGKPCAAYHVFALGGGQFRGVEERRATDFVMDVGGTSVLVRATRSGMVLTRFQHFASDTSHPRTLEMYALLVRTGCGGYAVAQRGSGQPEEQSFTYLQGVTGEGDCVAVSGVAMWEPDPNPAAAVGYREVAMRLVVLPSKRTEVVITDDALALESPRVSTRKRLAEAMPRIHGGVAAILLLISTVWLIDGFRRSIGEDAAAPGHRDVTGTAHAPRSGR